MVSEQAQAPTHLYTRQGITFTRTIFYTDSGGNPINLSGYVAKMVIRDSSEVTGSILYTLDSTNMSGTITFGPAVNQINLLIPDTDMQTFSWRLGYYTHVIKSAGGVVTLISFGNFNVAPTTTFI